MIQNPGLPIVDTSSSSGWTQVLGVYISTWTSFYASTSYTDYNSTLLSFDLLEPIDFSSCAYIYVSTRLSVKINSTFVNSSSYSALTTRMINMYTDGKLNVYQDVEASTSSQNMLCTFSGPVGSYIKYSTGTVYTSAGWIQGDTGSMGSVPSMTSTKFYFTGSHNTSGVELGTVKGNIGIFVM